MVGARAEKAAHYRWRMCSTLDELAWSGLGVVRLYAELASRLGFRLDAVRIRDLAADTKLPDPRAFASSPNPGSQPFRLSGLPAFPTCAMAPAFQAVAPADTA